MARISLYTGLYGENLVKYEMNEIDLNSGIFWDNNENSTSYDYKITGAYKTLNPLTGAENWCFSMSIPLKGVSYIKDVGDEVCPLADYDGTLKDYENGAFSLATSQPENFNIYFNDYCTKVTKNTKTMYDPCITNTYTEDSIYIPKKGYMLNHFYTFGQGYFSVKHLWNSNTQSNLWEQLILFFDRLKLNTLYSNSEMTGSFRVGGIDSASLFPLTFINSYSEYRYNNISPMIETNKSVLKLKFVGLTLPAGKMADGGASSTGDWGGTSTTFERNVIMPDTSLNAIGLMMMKYTSDNILQEASIIATTLDFWQPKNQVGNWGASSGVEGGDGTFTAKSDTTSKVDVISNTELKANHVMASRILSGNGFGLYTDFEARDLMSKLINTDFLERFKQTLYNPLSAVLNFCFFPEMYEEYPLTPYVEYTTGVVRKNIVLSGYDTDVISTRYTDNFIGYVDIGTVDLSSSYFGAFPDYEPYTHVVLNLPFAGKVSISPAVCMGGGIQILANIDFFNGNIIYNIITTDRNGIQYVSYSISGNLSYTLPLSAQQGGSAFNSFLTAAGLAVGGIATGSSTLGLQALGKVYEGITTSHYIQSTGNVSGNMSIMDDWTVWCEISRPEWSNPEKYSELIGIPSDISGTINANDSDFSPFTGFLKCKRFEAQGISGATAKEKSEIERLLTSGIYI